MFKPILNSKAKITGVYGSSAVEITNADFSRRYSMYHMPILSFREFLELTQDIKLESFTLEEILNSHEKIVDDIFDTLKN